MPRRVYIFKLRKPINIFRTLKSDTECEPRMISVINLPLLFAYDHKTQESLRLQDF